MPVFLETPPGGLRARPRRSRRRLRIPPALALCAACLVCGPAAGATRIAVAPPRVETALADVARGHADWVRAALRAAGFETAPGEKTRTAAGAAGGPGDLAAALGVELVLDTEIRVSRGVAVVEAVLHAAGGDRIAARARAEGPVDDLGAVARDTTADLLDRLGVSSAALRGGPTPRLVDLAACGRALSALDRGDFARAWREVEGRLTPSAERMRTHIAEMGSRPGVDAARRARLAIARGDLSTGIHLVRDRVRAGDDAEALVAAAEAAESAHRPRRARELYLAATALDPGRSDAQLGLGRALAPARRFEEARAALEQAALLDLADPEPLELQARLWPRDPERGARAHLRAAERASARFEPLRVESNVRRAAQLAPGLAGAAHALHGGFLAGVGRFAEAADAYTRALEHGAADAELWRGLGDARAALADHAAAEVAYRRALEIRPDDPAALHGLGRVYAESDRAGAAVETLERALALRPSDSKVRRTLARAARAAGDDARALEVLEQGSPSAADLEQVAAVHAARGEHDLAREALARAVELEPERPELREALAEQHAAAGADEAAQVQLAAARRLRGIDEPEPVDERAPDASPGEGGGPLRAAALLRDVVASFPARNPENGRPVRRVAVLPVREVRRDTADELLLWIAPLTLDRDRLDAALEAAVAKHFQVVPPPRDVEAIAPEIAALRRFGLGREAVATVNAGFESDAAFTARVTTADREALVRGDYDLELRMLMGASAPAVSVLENGLALPGDAGLLSWNARALGVYGLVALALLWPVLRGWGGLVVRVQYPERSKASFSIRVSKKPEKAKAGDAWRSHNKLERFQRRLRFAGRYERHMVGRETRFRWLPARTYHVAVHGLLRDALKEEVVGNYFEERAVRVRRGGRPEVTFDFTPRECPLEVIVMEGERPARRALVSIRARRNSLRYVRDGRALLYLGKGTHVVAVGGDERVAEREVVIDSFKPASLSVNLRDEHGLVFQGCPDAVEPYLQNNLEVAASALEAAGRAESAHLLRAELYRGRGDAGRSATHFEAAGRVIEAAELCAAQEEHARAAELFERAGAYGRAAEMYRQAGDLVRAGQAFESWGDFESAIECYREAGDQEHTLDLLEKANHFIEAAELASAQRDLDRAIRNLQQVDPSELEYAEACQKLATIFSERDEIELAIQKFEEVVQLSGEERAPLETLASLGDLLERSERLEAALELFEKIRSRDFQFGDASERITRLKARLAETREERKLQATLTEPIASRYEIQEEIGRGGMGVVYRARDRRLGRVVALKRLPENLRKHPTAVQLFLREARAAAALNHPNIVTLFDAGEENGNYYLTMELLEGHSLHAILARRNRLSVRDAARLGAQIADGLHYAHSRRIVHRDIKTANLFFTRERVLKIMDFGLAKMMEEVRRTSTVIGGTPYYMAPEQAAGERVDHRADLYAFGVTLFELVTGSVPFAEGDVTSHHRDTPPPDPRERVRDLPDAFAELVLALLVKDPDARIASAAEVGRRLQDLARATS